MAADAVDFVVPPSAIVVESRYSGERDGKFHVDFLKNKSLLIARMRDVLCDIRCTAIVELGVSGSCVCVAIPMFLQCNAGTATTTEFERKNRVQHCRSRGSRDSGRSFESGGRVFRII